MPTNRLSTTSWIFLVFATGAAGIAAQVFLLRELLVSFNGNELTIGIILSGWVTAEAAGALSGGRLKAARPYLFINLQPVFFLSLFTALYLARVFKNILGIGFGEAVGPDVALLSLLIIAVPAFIHGALFSIACTVFSRVGQGVTRSIGRVYAWETFGTLAGGVALSYFFIPWFDPFAAAFVISVFVFAACFSLLVISGARRVYTLFAAGLILSYVFMGQGAVETLQARSLARQWAGVNLLESVDSVYGNVSVTSTAGQYTFYYNGLPQVTTPNPDSQFTGDFANIPLLFHARPRDVLVIGSGAGGILQQILRHDIGRVDYAEIDPKVIAAIQKFPTELTVQELGDDRVNIINLDGRYYLRSTGLDYDVILIGLSDPADLTVNRLFTKEFYAMAARRLKPGGIIAYWLPRDEAYMSREQARINDAVFSAFGETFGWTRVVPGDYYAIYLGSKDADIKQVTSKIIIDRMIERKIEHPTLAGSYIDYLLQPEKEAVFTRSFVSTARGTNSDARPVAVFDSFLYDSKKFLSAPAWIMSLMQGLGPVSSCAAVMAPFLLMPALFFRRKTQTAPVLYSIAVTGFFGMLSSLALMFIFQAWYGYVFGFISLFIAVFMAGAGFGGLWGARLAERRSAGRVFLLLEFGIIIVCIAIAFLSVTQFKQAGYVFAEILALLAACGFLAGMQFPLAAASMGSGLVKPGSDPIPAAGNISGALYAADLAGGCVAGVFGGVILLPVAGLVNTCLLMAFLKLSSLIWLSLSQRGRSPRCHPLNRV